MKIRTFERRKLIIWQIISACFVVVGFIIIKFNEGIAVVSFMLGVNGIWVSPIFCRQTIIFSTDTIYIRYETIKFKFCNIYEITDVYLVEFAGASKNNYWYVLKSARNEDIKLTYSDCIHKYISSVRDVLRFKCTARSQRIVEKYFKVEVQKIVVDAETGKLV